MMSDSDVKCLSENILLDKLKNNTTKVRGQHIKLVSEKHSAQSIKLVRNKNINRLEI